MGWGTPPLFAAKPFLISYPAPVRRRAEDGQGSPPAPCPLRSPRALPRKARSRCTPRERTGHTDSKRRPAARLGRGRVTRRRARSTPRHRGRIVRCAGVGRHAPRAMDIPGARPW